jgi:hypothetical protein
MANDKHEGRAFRMFQFSTRLASLGKLSLLRLALLGSVGAVATVFVAGGVLAQEGSASSAAPLADSSRVYAGRSTEYQNLDQSSLEAVSTPERIVAVTRPNVAPMEVWRALEHAERVECLSCIPQVATLLYNEHPRTREIAAWWLRRRILGVFGPGQVYEQTVNTLNDADESVAHRVAAAEALGEFLTRAGVPHVARAATSDPAPEVRIAALRALQRLNTEGPAGELGQAMADGDERVRLQAVQSAIKVNSFSGIPALVERLSDESPAVRVRAAQVLGQMKARDAVSTLIGLSDAQNEGNAEVRSAALAALGHIGDSTARSAVEAAVDADPDGFVRNAARIALRQL